LPGGNINQTVEDDDSDMRMLWIGALFFGVALLLTTKRKSK